ncbi:putative oligopeptide transporter, OPT family [Cnuella takakiae]|uniref:Putative oligopeptide transporter, OPT family n=1 Tax=Cnuella takakiae TaxID=1302690 RepID=A0A1M5CZF1_9BACT|nr:OPT/YSL family transporter [Cnuella takakiae]OLY94158.1 peptide transporter [Cnuella takakiae]SHF60071.1 putative oligopeptide transporter, OPT family [Cnuella takakiae]
MSQDFQPFVPAQTRMKEFTLKAILLGSLFGILFGAATVYLALRAGLTVSASIPIAVIAITIGRWLFKTTILENNIIQTTGSAGESIAAGVAFTLPGFLFLTIGTDGRSVGASYFDYVTIFVLAIVGGVLGTMMMIPLRRTLIVQEHGVLPYPEGTACAAVLKAGERGGDFAKTAFYGLGVAVGYAFLQRILRVIAEAPVYMTAFRNRYFPSANIAADITPEYLGVGYIIGPRISGILVAGGVLSWLVLNPLLASIIDPSLIAAQLVKLGYLKDVAVAGGPGGWNPVTKEFADTGSALYRAYIRQIGAGAVAAGGFITLLKTIPTIISSFKSSLQGVKATDATESVKRTDRDLDVRVVLFGSIALIVLIAVLPMIPGNTVLNKILIGVLVVIFGAFFVTVASRIVGLIGSSNSPVSGMTIATILATALLFISIGWNGAVYEPMVLVVGGIICIAAANAGATSQDLKTGYIVGATPRYQQLALFIGAIVSSIAIGITVKILDNPTQEMLSQGITHAIGSDKYPAPQATLMATLIRGVLSFNLDWQFVFVGVFLAIVMELCGIKSLSFAVGAYLPLATTLPIFAGGLIKGWVERKQQPVNPEEEDLGKGNLFATGLVAGGALFGVVVAFLQAFPSTEQGLQRISMEEGLVQSLGEQGFYLLGVAFFVLMCILLYRTAKKH